MSIYRQTDFEAQHNSSLRNAARGVRIMVLVWGGLFCRIRNGKSR